MWWHLTNSLSIRHESHTRREAGMHNERISPWSSMCPSIWTSNWNFENVATKRVFDGLNLLLLLHDIFRPYYRDLNLNRICRYDVVCVIFGGVRLARTCLYIEAPNAAVNWNRRSLVAIFGYRMHHENREVRSSLSNQKNSSMIKLQNHPGHRAQGAHYRKQRTNTYCLHAT